MNLVRYLKKEAAAEVGIYRADAPLFSTLVDRAKHLWVTATHVTVIDADTAQYLYRKELASSRSGGGSHFTSARYLTGARIRPLSE